MHGVDAVATTGIYCRPGCGARPKPGNVTTYAIAAAAEAAGFRACLRCRPYRIPPSLRWTDSEVVCRAVQLVLDGALDHGTEAALSSRLGLSARHLRRLFMAHLGVTPDRLARSARAHFARRLLDDTDLSVTEIAYCAGFGSLRQFNRSCREVFRAAPSELRAKRRKADRLVADGGLLLRLAHDGPLDWAATLSHLAARAVPGVEHVSEGTYRRTVGIDGDPGAVELFPGGPDHLVLRAHLPHWEGLVHLINRVRRIPNLDLDHDAAVRRLAGDPLLGALVRGRPDVRVPGTWDPFETGVRAIVDRHDDAGGLERLVRRHGMPVPGLAELGLTHVFPPPAVLAAADPDELGFRPGIGRVVRAFADAVRTDAVRLDRSVDLDELIRSLTAVPGIDGRTANYLALRLGEPDAHPLTPADLEPLGATASRDVQSSRRWRPWRALAATHLWLADSRPQVNSERKGVA